MFCYNKVYNTGRRWKADFCELYTQNFLFIFVIYIGIIDAGGHNMYKVVQIWPGLFVCKQVTVCPGHIWTTLY
jgi:hypothetical protein